MTRLTQIVEQWAHAVDTLKIIPRLWASQVDMGVSNIFIWNGAR